MYCTYRYIAGATAADILADMVAILTGTTNVNSLSASCDKTNTTIDTSAKAAGWTVHDASAGTNAQVLKAAVADNASQFKFMQINTNTAGSIILKLYEAWNETTHAGTNLAYGSDTTNYSQRLNVTSGGQLDISASARHCIMFSLQSGVFGSPTGTHPSGVLERTRNSNWDTVVNGYLPALFFLGASSYSAECRRMNYTGGDSTGMSAPLTLFTPLGVVVGSSWVASSIPVLSTKTFGHVMLPISFVHQTDGHFGGDVSSLCDVYLTTYNNGQAYDLIVYKGNTYVVWTSGSFRFAVRKG